MTCWNGFLLQFLNVKVIMLGLAAYPGYFLPWGHSLDLTALFAMTLCCGAGNLLWAMAGNLLCPIYNRYYRKVNLVMGFLLVYCAMKIVSL